MKVLVSDVCDFHNLLNAIFLVFSIILFIFLLPTLWLFNILRFYFKSMYPEELAGKVILITGASAGIGEHLAMEYAKEGACLALVARREKELEIVAQNAKAMGSPNVIAISADVSKLHDCNRFVDQTIKHFGKLDYLITNAAIVTFGFFEDQTCVPDDHASIMNVNFWGSVFTIHFALPHLQRNQGKIIAICSCGDWFGTPRVSVYNASKAALRSFLETLKMELGSKTEITIVTPGLVNTRLIDHEWVKKVYIFNFNHLTL
ncbi:hypothetical protein OSB04_003805 [Centaurea solstitialis]|uniref:Uncharacterized protein n=1 Tax=Centaurea solstitialis TaxID=347529 RepID=A0AA38TVV2_9ASTR|nr:hypothetical protein OSB04_003805 [Centaurea solstitialis]